MGGELLKRFNSILKISIFLLLFMMVVGAVSAEDIDDSDSLTPNESDLEVDDDVSDLDDIDDDADDSDDLEDGDIDDETDDSDDLDDEDDETDDEDEFEDDWDDEFDFNDSDYDFEGDNITDFEYLTLRIESYLLKFGNATSDNWYESEEFLNELQNFNSTNLESYLNESDENYEIYSKIYNSIVSTFDKYNLTDNETEYLKFFILYYLNHFGNCTDYEWNESDEFSDFNINYLDSAIWLAKGAAFACGSDAIGNSCSDIYQHFTNPITASLLENVNSTDKNSTNGTNFTVNEASSDDYNWILILLLMLVLIILII